MSKEWRCEFDPAGHGGDQQGVTILDANGSVIHSSTTWEATAQHLMFALQDRTELQAENAKLRQEREIQNHMIAELLAQSHTFCAQRDEALAHEKRAMNTLKLHAGDVMSLNGEFERARVDAEEAQAACAKAEGLLVKWRAVVAWWQRYGWSFDQWPDQFAAEYPDKSRSLAGMMADALSTTSAAYPAGKGERT